MRALVDADMTAHECGHLKDGTGEFDEEGKEIKALIPLKAAKKVADGLFQSLTLRAGCSVYEAYVSGGRNFRHSIATIRDYKGHREGQDREHADTIKDYIRDEFGAIDCKDYEADDAISMRMWQHWDKLMHKHSGDEEKVANDMDLVIVSRDKDFRNAPGWHFSWTPGDGDDPPPFYITFIQAIRHFYKQMLTGDTADNIPGLYGVGEKSAWVKQIDDMDNEDDMAAHVHDKYVKHYNNYADKFFYEVGNLLHLWRRPRDEWVEPWNRDEDYWNI